MAMYVFRCQGCGHEFTVMTSWSRKGEVRCPECGSADLAEQWGQYRVASVGGGDLPLAGGCGCVPGGG